MFDGVQAGRHASGAVSQHEQRKLWLARLAETHHAVDVAHVVCEGRDVEAFAVGLPSAPQIHGIQWPDRA